ncbi:hypothetical protein ACFSQQ_19915 [Mesorhizobium kowhaii]|uniref:Uncharacterized protein n=1 Tax=Mesorhizobium kowhaii TaxID=1300272 RepID=A0A2W7C976_9HYPH|nr:hypothetical protein [Mesorhizobium kowhaii]PZV39685.1 hypothetical protein B5V02_07030 [Mesorhizobium kowhaii]
MEAISIAWFFSWQLWLTALSLIEGHPMHRVIFRTILLMGALALLGCERSSPFGKPEQPAKSAAQVVISP